jgi:hypothetical protein
MSDEPATKRQKVKLRFYGIAFPATLTKRAASELLDRIDDPVREQKYRAYRDELDANEGAAEDMNLRIDVWQSSLEMRDYRKVSRAKVKDILTFLDETTPGWDAGSFSPLFYDTLEARHPEVLKTATPRGQKQQSSAGCLVTLMALATLSISLLWVYLTRHI